MFQQDEAMKQYHGICAPNEQFGGYVNELSRKTAQVVWRGAFYSLELPNGCHCESTGDICLGMSDEYDLEKFGRHVPHILEKQLIANLACQVKPTVLSITSLITLPFQYSLRMAANYNIPSPINLILYHLRSPIFMEHYFLLTFLASLFSLRGCQLMSSERKSTDILNEF